VSETIRVRSIIGRFLEHSRIFYFNNGGEEKIYVGSADLMPRNLNRRVEVLFPIENARMQRRIRDKILEKYLADTGAARLMQPDGTFIRQRIKPGRKALNAQEWFMKHEA
jgi:polyphosphate kinase